MYGLLMAIFVLILVGAAILKVRDLVFNAACPYCRSSIARGAVKCPKCQSDLTTGR